MKVSSLSQYDVANWRDMTQSICDIRSIHGTPWTLASLEDSEEPIVSGLGDSETCFSYVKKAGSMGQGQKDVFVA